MFGFSSRDMGIDLGTANTLIYIKDKGIVVNEPSVIAYDKRTSKIIAIGSDAKVMYGKAPKNIVVVRPLRDGVISDFDMCAEMLQRFIGMATGEKKISGFRVSVGVPSGVTEVEKLAVEEVVMQMGAKDVYVLDEPTAAALGAGYDVDSSTACMIADIGGGTSEVAVISLGGIVSSCSVRVGGDCLDDAIIRHVKQSYSLLIGERTAEDVKIQIGSAFPLGENEEMVVKGRSLSDGLPKDVTLTADEVRDALSPQLEKIIRVVADATQIDPRLMAPVFAVPMLLVLFIIMMISTGRKNRKIKPRRKVG